MIALIAGILPLALQILGFFLGKSAASDKVKQKYLELVGMVESDLGVSVRLGDSARSQLEALKKEIVP